MDRLVLYPNLSIISDTQSLYFGTTRPAISKKFGSFFGSIWRLAEIAAIAAEPRSASEEECDNKYRSPSESGRKFQYPEYVSKKMNSLFDLT